MIMSRRYYITQWKNLNPDDEYSLGSLHLRFELLAKDDPFVRFFSDDVIRSLADAVTSEQGVGDSSLSYIMVHGPQRLRERVLRCIDFSPLARLITPAFSERIADLFEVAMFPQNSSV